MAVQDPVGACAIVGPPFCCALTRFESDVWVLGSKSSARTLWVASWRSVARSPPYRSGLTGPGWFQLDGATSAHRVVSRTAQGASSPAFRRIAFAPLNLSSPAPLRTKSQLKKFGVLVTSHLRAVTTNAHSWITVCLAARAVLPL